MYEASQLLAALEDVLGSRPRVALGDAARILGVDRHTLERACARDGKTFRDYRRDAILAAATNLLLITPPLSVKEVAFRLGFESLGAFTNFVTRATGRPPSRWRRKSATRVKVCPAT